MLNPEREDLERLERVMREFAEAGHVGHHIFMGSDFARVARGTLRELDSRRRARAARTDLREICP